MLTKYTNCEIIEVKSADEKIEGNAKFSSFDHIPQDTYRTNDGYIYVKVRAISSRVNKNFDGWPVNELAGMDENDFKQVVSGLDKDGLSKEATLTDRLTFTKDGANLKSKGDYGFRTFVGRPVFIDHNNSDPQRTRGVVVDAMLHIEPVYKIASDSYWGSAPENHKPETWIELLLEVDGKTFPKLAKALVEGHVNAVSMGCNVEYTLCSICNHKAATVDEYCDHVRKKGTTFKTGRVDKISYEDCYNVNFFEISAVFDPADVTALFTEPVMKHAATEPAYVTQVLKLMEDLAKRTNRQKEELNNSERGQSNQEEKASIQEFIDLIQKREPELSKHGIVTSQLVSAANTYRDFLQQMSNKTEYMSDANEEDFQMYLALADKISKQIQNFVNMYAQEPIEYARKSLKEIGINYEKSPSSEDYDFLLDNRIDPKSVLSKEARSSEDFLAAAFGAGEAYDQIPVATPEFDSIKMAEYLGVEPHDPDMHLYMKAYEDGISGKPNGLHDLKVANPESQSLEGNFDKFPNGRKSSVNKEINKYGDSITAPSNVNTLKSEKPCPIGLAGECGLDDESGRCEKCGYREPPAPLDDPDLSKARAFDRQKEENKDKLRDDTKGLIDKLKRVLSKNEIRSVNSKMNKTAKITLAAEVEEVPGDEYLTELGWTIPEKDSSASSSATPLVEDGRPASDRPKGEKVISDQLEPVESATKVALGELPGLTQPNGGESTPQFKGDKNNESSGITEYDPQGYVVEQYKSVKHPVEEPQFADEGNTKDIKKHNPATMSEQYQGVKKEIETPQFHGDGGFGGKKKSESSVLSAIKLADLEVELGLNEVEMKYARVAELENEDSSIVEAKYETLVKIKEAGLGKRETSSKKLASFPSMKGTKESSVTSSVGTLPDDAIFN